MTHNARLSTDSDYAALHRSVMDHYAPPSVMIDAQDHVVHFSSNAAKYLHIPGGELTQDLTRLVREPIRSELLKGLRIGRRASRSWASGPIPVHTEDGPHRIHLRVEPIPITGLNLVIFDDREPTSKWG